MSITKLIPGNFYEANNLIELWSIKEDNWMDIPKNSILLYVKSIDWPFEIISDNESTNYYLFLLGSSFYVLYAPLFLKRFSVDRDPISYMDSLSLIE